MNFLKYFNAAFMLFIFVCSNQILAVGSSDDELESTDIVIKQKKPHKKEKSSEKDQELLQLENDSYEKKLSKLNTQLSTLTTQIADYLGKINENNTLLAKHGLPTVIPCFQEIDNLRSLAEIAETDGWRNPVVVTTLSYPQFYNDVTENFVFYRALRNLHSESMPGGDVKIIDAGGGTGLLARHLKAEDSKREIEIFDLSREMTEIAIEKGIPSANVHISTITSLLRSNGTQVPDNSIDGIMTNHVLYQLSLEEVNHFFTEAYRVLKKDGKLSVASMRTVSKKKMDKFTHFLKSEVKKMEQEKLVSEGVSDLFFELRQNLLTQSSPTTFTGQEITALGRSHGFEETFLDENCYMETVFFISFKKL